MRGVFRLLVCFGCVALAGCAGLLPRTRSDDVSHFDSCDDACAAIERVAPCRTRVADLKALHFDLEASANVQQLPYPPWVGTLVQANVPLDRADIGVRDCLAAEQACRAYVFRFGNHGGQPRIELVEDRANPLGPFQSLGESVPSGLVP
jgi:hypothetical protein